VLRRRQKYEALILGGLLVVLVCSSVGMASFVMYGLSLSFFGLVVDELPNQPDNFFTLTTPDAAFVQAISQPDGDVGLNSLDQTIIDELIIQHETGNVQYQNQYYSVSILLIDTAYDNIEVRLGVFWVSFVGLIASGSSLVYFAIVRLRGVSKKKTLQST
jgi:hypothetical protein